MNDHSRINEATNLLRRARDLLTHPDTQRARRLVEDIDEHFNAVVQAEHACEVTIGEPIADSHWMNERTDDPIPVDEVRAFYAEASKGANAG